MSDILKDDDLCQICGKVYGLHSYFGESCPSFGRIYKDTVFTKDNLITIYKDIENMLNTASNKLIKQ